MDWIKLSVLAVGCLVFVKAAPETPIQILSQSSDSSADGGYKWSFEAENGIKAEETGTSKKGARPDDESAIVVQGSFSYNDLDGNQVAVSYVADDEGGFQPQGAHFPTSPPIPPAIQKSLEWNAAHPEQESGQRRK